MPAGLLQLQAVPNDSLASYIPTQLETKSGEIYLVTQNLLHKVGALGGAMSGGFVHSLEWTKDEVQQKIRLKTPVKIGD
jgi:hypothetical protein